MALLSGILNVRGVFGVRKKLYAATAILAAVSGTVAAVSYYGQYTGQFVVSVDDSLEQRGIALTDTLSDDSYSPRLKTNGITDVVPITQDDISTTLARETEGYFYDPKLPDYFAYTFYLLNVGETTTNVLITMSVSDKIGTAVQSSRIWFFQGDDAEDVGDVYKLAEENPEDEGIPEAAGGEAAFIPNPKNFVDEDIVFTKQIDELNPGDQIKFTFIVWIEGWDPDCTDVGVKDIRDSSVKYRLDFAIPTLGEEVEADESSVNTNSYIENKSYLPVPLINYTSKGVGDEDA